MPGGFDAHDEQIQAELGRQQPTHPKPGLLLGPEPDYTQPVTCRCNAVEVPFHRGAVPCVEPAGDGGLCPACRLGLCKPAIDSTEAA
jgi:hypothetical protein